MSTISKTLKTGILGGLTAVMMSASAFAGGDLMAPPAQKSACGLSANVALTNDYIFRGVTQTDGDAAVQGGVDASCGIFYAGVWGSNVDFGDDTTVEVDFYAGIKPVYKGITFDLGVIVYAYDDADEVVEVKLGASAEVYAGATLGFTTYLNTDDEVYTYEFAFEKAFSSKIGPFTPTFKAVVGLVDDDTDFTGLGGDYTYWNAGVSLGFASNYAIDLRYHDTDVDTAASDERFTATLSASF
ncbi:MAG: TorF family putative porin [Methyloligellaceae bacterium]